MKCFWRILDVAASMAAVPARQRRSVSMAGRSRKVTSVPGTCRQKLPFACARPSLPLHMSCLRQRQTLSLGPTFCNAPQGKQRSGRTTKEAALHCEI